MDFRSSKCQQREKVYYRGSCLAGSQKYMDKRISSAEPRFHDLFCFPSPICVLSSQVSHCDKTVHRAFQVRSHRLNCNTRSQKAKVDRGVGQEHPILQSFLCTPEVCLSYLYPLRFRCTHRQGSSLHEVSKSNGLAAR